MGLSISEKLALIREYKSQGGKQHYLGIIKDYENKYPDGGTIKPAVDTVGFAEKAHNLLLSNVHRGEDGFIGFKRDIDYAQNSPAIMNSLGRKSENQNWFMTGDKEGYTMYPQRIEKPYSRESSFVDNPIEAMKIAKNNHSAIPLGKDRPFADYVSTIGVTESNKIANPVAYQTAQNTFAKRVNIKPLDSYSKYPDGGLINIKDKRQVRATTGQLINPNTDLFTGKYDSGYIGNIVNAASRYGIDPNTLLAMDLQETKLGNDKTGSVGQVKSNYNVTIPSKQDLEIPDDYDIFARAYMQKQNDAKRLGITDEATKIQTYNGLGKIGKNTEKKFYGHSNKQFYGVDIPSGGIDMKKNPLYGKQVIDVRDNIIKRNPDLQRFVANTVNPSQIPTTQPVWPPLYKQGGYLKKNKTIMI